MADAQGVSINQFLSTLIAERIGELKALRHVRQRIGRANPATAAAVDRAPLESACVVRDLGAQKFIIADSPLFPDRPEGADEDKLRCQQE